MRDTYPRTLEEAFGPYTSRDMASDDNLDPLDYGRLWWTCMGVIAVATGVLLFVTK